MVLGYSPPFSYKCGREKSGSTERNSNPDIQLRALSLPLAYCPHWNEANERQTGVHGHHRHRHRHRHTNWFLCSGMRLVAVVAFSLCNARRCKTLWGWCGSRSRVPGLAAGHGRHAVKDRCARMAAIWQMCQAKMPDRSFTSRELCC